MSVVELVVGISILIIIYSIAFPKAKTEEYEINSFIRQLVSDIRYVRQENTMENSTAYVYLTYDTNYKKYGYILRNNSVEIKKIYLPKNVKLRTSGNVSRIIFTENGNPSKSSTTITINYEGIDKQITITPVSGRVLYKEEQYGT